MREFIRTWLIGYRSPARLVEALRGKPAPHWGLYGQGLRILLDSLLLYLPLALLGRQPSTPPYITFLPAAGYYGALVFLSPYVLLVQWLFLCAMLHVILRLLRRPSEIDQILNITGMTALVVGAFVVAWDWVYVLLGGRSDVALGLSHQVLNLWGLAIIVLGFKRLLGVPVWLGILFAVLWITLGIPLGLVLRAPV